MGALLAERRRGSDDGICGNTDEHHFATMLRKLHELSGVEMPIAVTIARSVDGFLPLKCAAQLETSVMQSLRLAFNQSLDVEFLPGVAPHAALLEAIGDHSDSA